MLLVWGNIGWDSCPNSMWWSWLSIIKRHVLTWIRFVVHSRSTSLMQDRWGSVVRATNTLLILKCIAMIVFLWPVHRSSTLHALLDSNLPIVCTASFGPSTCSHSCSRWEMKKAGFWKWSIWIEIILLMSMIASSTMMCDCSRRNSYTTKLLKYHFYPYHLIRECSSRERRNSQ